MQISRRKTIASLICVLLVTTFATASNEKNIINIGYQKLLEEPIDFTYIEVYLEEKIPEYKFKVIPYSPTTLLDSFYWGEVDFSLCTPYTYCIISKNKGCKILATLTIMGPNSKLLKLQAGTIFCKAERSDLNYIYDIRGKIIASPGRDYFAGWILPLYEFSKYNLLPISDHGAVIFTGSHESTIYSVLKGSADVGCVDAYIFWKLCNDGKIDGNRFKVINLKEPNPNFPIPHSTEVFPEYCFIAQLNTSEELQRKITVALLSIPRENPLTPIIGFAGFSLPEDYSGVEKILKTIKYHPFEKPLKVSVKDFIQNNWLLITIILLIWILLTLFIITLLHSIHRVRAHKETLALLNKSLEMQRKLEESETRFKILAEQFPGAVFIAKDDSNFSILYITPQIEELTGYTKDSFLSGELNLLQLIHNEDRDYVLSERVEKIKARKPYQITYRMLTKDEKWIWINEIGTGVWDNSKLLYIQGYLWDATQTKIEEEARNKKFERTNLEKEILIEVMLRPEITEGDFDGLSQFITEIIGTKLKIPRVNIWLFNENQTELICIDHYDSSTGIHSKGMILKEEEFLSEFSALKTSKYVDAVDALSDPRTKGYANNYLIPLNITSMLDTSIRIGEKNMGVICFEYTHTQHKWEEDEIAFASQIADQLALTLINKEKKSYESQRELLIRTIETSEFGMIISDINGRILYINPAIFIFLNISPEKYINKSIDDLAKDALPIENLWEKLKEVEKGKIHKERLECKRTGTTPLILDCSISSIHNVDGIPSYFVFYINDVTREVKLENDLRQSQKMESIGQLAGGIAHDINNHLLVIQGYAELIESELPPNSTLIQYLREMKNANSKASALIKQLLAFARKQLLKKEPISLNEIIKSTENLIKRVIKENIVIETILTPDIPNIYADKNAIEVIIINLCSNANDAMPEGGKLTIETGKVYLSKEKIEGLPGVKEGEFVLLSITDTGVGMDKHTLEHCFEPFFTTKEPGKGTGLGLSTVYGLVQQHEGIIHCYSEVGKGTTFKIYLPATTISSSKEKTESIDDSSLVGSETILLAEDEPSVRVVTTRILEQAGYKVIPAENGERALELFTQSSDEIDLVILDIVMPILGGKDVYERIKKIKPEVPVLFTSGYSENSVHTNFVIHEGYQILQKPYGRIEVLKEVRKILDKKK